MLEILNEVSSEKRKKGIGGQKPVIDRKKEERNARRLYSCY